MQKLKTALISSSEKLELAKQQINNTKTKSGVQLAMEAGIIPKKGSMSKIKGGRYTT